MFLKILSDILSRPMHLAMNVLNVSDMTCLSDPLFSVREQAPLNFNSAESSFVKFHVKFFKHVVLNRVRIFII